MCDEISSTRVSTSSVAIGLAHQVITASIVGETGALRKIGLAVEGVRSGDAGREQRGVTVGVSSPSSSTELKFAAWALERDSPSQLIWKLGRATGCFTSALEYLCCCLARRLYLGEMKSFRGCSWGLSGFVTFTVLRGLCWGTSAVKLDIQ
jgi:hypothetical protein